MQHWKNQPQAWAVPKDAVLKLVVMPLQHIVQEVVHFNMKFLNVCISANVMHNAFILETVAMTTGMFAHSLIISK